MSPVSDSMEDGHVRTDAKILSTITEREEADRMSMRSGVSESTVFSSTSGQWNSWGTEKTHHSASRRLPGDMIFLPPSIQSPMQKGFYSGPIVTDIPSRGISRVSIPISQLQNMHNRRRPSFDDGRPVPADQDAPPIPPLVPPPGFAPVRGNEETATQQQAVHFATESPTLGKTSYYGSDGTVPTSYMTTPEGSPPLESQFTPPWPLPMPEKDSSHSSHSSRSQNLKHDSGFSDLPAYPGTPGSRFSWPMKPQEVARSWFTRWFIEWWMFEIGAWIFSLLCVAGIVATLIYFDGRELPEWKLGITINAFIAIFAGFAKSALLVPTAEALGQLKWDWYRKKPKKMMDFEILDSASRGPWGSLVLLTRTKGITLASVGAAVVLLSLPLDLFFQQIVSFPTVSILESQNATVGRAVFYDPDKSAMIWNGSTTYRADWTMENAVIGNFYKRPWATEVDYVCPTKNCTWEPFYTLAVRGSCQEMDSSFLELGCHEVSGAWMSDVVPDPTQKSNVIPNATTCGWYMNPTDAPRELMIGYLVNSDGSTGEALITRLFSLRDQFTRDAIYDGSINFDKHVKTTIQDFIMVASPDGAVGAYKNATPVVHECELHWTVERRETAVQDGILREVTTEILDLDVIETGNTKGTNPWITMGWYGLNFSKSVADPGSSASLQFGMSNLTARRTMQALEEVVPASVTADDADSVPVAKTFWRGSKPDTRALRNSLNPWLPPMSATEYIEGIASAMTIAARRTGNIADTQHDQVAGKAWDDRTLIEVNWVWISLPIALLLTSLVFLVATIVRSSKEESMLGVWKTSALAVLFNGLGQDVQEQPGAHDRLGQARSKAKRLNVQLDK